MNERLDDIRLRTENFFQEIEREYYFVRSGVKARLNTSAIYEHFADLGSQALIEYIRGKVDSSRDSLSNTGSSRKLSLMLKNTIETSLHYEVRELSDRLWAIEAQGGSAREKAIRQSRSYCRNWHWALSLIGPVVV